MQNIVNQSKGGGFNCCDLHLLPILVSVTARLTVW